MSKLKIPKRRMANKNNSPNTTGGMYRIKSRQCFTKQSEPCQLTLLLGKMLGRRRRRLLRLLAFGVGASYDFCLG